MLRTGSEAGGYDEKSVGILETDADGFSVDGESGGALESATADGESGATLAATVAGVMVPIPKGTAAS
jgi:hypothetical protein